MDYPKVADYFVVAGLTDTSKLLDEELAFPDLNHKLNPEPKDPITDICVIDRTLEEKCPQGFTCIDKTPSGLLADLNHGSLTAHNIFLCYRRGRDKPPLVDIGVYYEGLETVRDGISIIETTPTGRNANVNNKSGMGSYPIYLTYRRAEDSAPQSTLVVTDLCVILTNKNEYPPYAYCLIDKNLNKGMIGSSVYLCYKKSMRQVNSVAFKAGCLSRYPLEDNGSFSLPSTVPLFCLPMGATIECWSSKMKHPLPSFSSFVLTTETSEKVYGAVVSFYENYPIELLRDEHKFKLGLLRGDGHIARGKKTIHTNKAICLLSRWPLFDAFRDFLIYLYRLTVSPIAHAVPVERHIAHFMHNVPFPSPERPRVQYQMSPMHATILTRPQMTPIPLSGASFLALIDDLGADNTLTLFTLALTEHKIVIHSLRRAEITRVAEALITLLFPFKWQCTYVPLCPLEMAYVLEAPCPFIIGVDSRYFDLYEPPRDVACVNLDTNNITLLGEKKINWKLLPKKPAKHARSILQALFTEIKQLYPRMKDNEGEYMSLVFDPELARSKRHMQIELIVQETILKFMATIMHGYRQYLLPITEAPNIGTTDPASLFCIQDFLRSRDRSSQRFFSMLTRTQLFAAFIEERSFASLSGGEGTGKATSLVFFDECIDRLDNEHPDNCRLIEADDTLKSEHTVFIMPPEEPPGLPSELGYQYTTFPQLQEELFSLDGEFSLMDLQVSRDKQIRSSTFIIGKRTKQETRITQKEAKLYSHDATMWARHLFSSTYAVWFCCVAEYMKQCRSKAAVLRAAHDTLYELRDKGCIPLPDETCYRVLMHLCYTYNKPALAVRIFHFVRDSGTRLSAITYGLYNKAVLESVWPSSNRDGYMLWQKLRNVFEATVRLRRSIRHFNNNSAGTFLDDDDDTDSSSRNELMTKNDLLQQPFLKEEENSLAPIKQENQSNMNKDNSSSGGQSDHGYNSMPKDLIHRGSPQQPKSRDARCDEDHDKKSIETTDSLLSSVSEETDFKSQPSPTDLPACRIQQPPASLPLTGVSTPYSDARNDIDVDTINTIGQDGQSDETLVDFASELEGSEIKQYKNCSDQTPPASNSLCHRLNPRFQNLDDHIISSSALITTEYDAVSDPVFDSQNCSHEDQNEVSSPCINSPSTPEMIAFFGDDSKLLSGLSDSDMRRHQELCGRRSSSFDHETPHNNSRSLHSSNNHTETISPLIGQKPVDTHFKGSANVAEDKALRSNFDNLTADDIATPSSPLKAGSIFNSGGCSRSRLVNQKNRKHQLFEDIQVGEKKSATSEALSVLTSTPKSTTFHEYSSKISDVHESLPGNKMLVQRQDITNLALDPLSLPSSEHCRKNEQSEFQEERENTSMNNHLVDEIHLYLNRDAISEESELNSSLPVSGIQKNRQDSVENHTLKRQTSAPADTTTANSKHPPPGLLSRSLTFAQGSTISSSLFSSGSKLNSLLKATTMGMASKAKQLASTLAKDINETVHTNLAYYTPEKFKGSLSELTENQASIDTFSSNTLMGINKQDQYSSQSSLRSADSIHSSTDGMGKVRNRGPRKKGKDHSRPLSMPTLEVTNAGDLTSSMADHSEGVRSKFTQQLASSMNSLSIKENQDMAITISSCSKCHRCECLIYDEEIMAGWIADESNLNTHCPFCNTLFVPFLNIEIKDFRVQGALLKADSQHCQPTSKPVEKQCIIPQSICLPDSSVESILEKSADIIESNSKNEEDFLTLNNPSVNMLTPISPNNDSCETEASGEEQPTMEKSSMLSPLSPVSSHVSNSEEEYISVEPLSVPYLSPLVLRKEVESLLENEGTKVLSEAEFVDLHPIIYWNLVWYFRRLGLHSNLYNLVLASKLTTSKNREDSLKSTLDGGVVSIHIMWDNLKLHGNMTKPPLYWVYHQLILQEDPSAQVKNQPYTRGFLDDIKKSIISDDVKSPLVSLLNEFSTHFSNSKKPLRRSVYREILFLVIVALGKDSIDVDAFDRVYREAYESLSVQELGLARKCDKPPNSHAQECRKMFGELDLY